MNKSEELIACLEGEIAKRDEELAACRVAVENCDLFRARIAALEAVLYAERIEADDQRKELDAASENLAGLRAELAAIKAQEPVAFAFRYDDGSWHDVSETHHSAGMVSLYAAPVSEAKAQGVVMPDVNAAAKALCNRHAMICGIDVDDQWKQYSQDFIADAETVLANARLNAAPVQQVSVPDEREAFEKWGETLFFSACFERHGSDEYAGRGLQGAWLGWQARAMLAAAPAAPAADAGLVEALEKLARLGNGDKYGNSDGNLIAQAAIAAHIVKGEA